MKLYQNLTDVELAAKITYLTEKLETVVGGGVALVVAGESRRIEYSRANQQGLEALLKAAQNEQDRRNGIQVSGAIGVSYPYADGC